MSDSEGEYNTTTINGGEIGLNYAYSNKTADGIYIDVYQARNAKIYYTSGRINIANGFASGGNGVIYKNGGVAYNNGTTYNNGVSPEGSMSNITLNANGGSGGTESISSQSWNTTLPNIIPPTRTGYTFNGYKNSNGEWYYNANGTPYNKTNGGTKWDYIGDQTLTAQWTANTYEIAYNDNGGSGGPTGTVSATYDKSYTLSAIVPTLTGYTFKEWNTAQDGSGTAYQSGASVSNLTSTNGATATLYAQWTENTSTLTYDANGHGVAPDVVTMKYTEAINATEGLTATGYTFSSWNTAADGSGTSYEAGALIKEENVDPEPTTLYAQWTAKQCTVTLNRLDGSEAAETVTATYDSAMPMIATPTIAGYNFAGYYDAKKGGTKYYNSDGTSAHIWDKDEATPVLYARWAVPEVAPTCTNHGQNTYIVADDYYLDVACTEQIKDLDFWKTDGEGGYIPATGHTYSSDADCECDVCLAVDENREAKTSSSKFYFQGASLSLDGDITLNFYTHVDDAIQEDSYMEFSVSGKNKTKVTQGIDQAENGLYKFSCPLSILQTAETVTATFHYTENDEPKEATMNYSVQEYVEALIRQDKDEKGISLVKDIVNYGYYAQLALAEANGFELGKDYKHNYHFGELNRLSEEEKTTVNNTFKHLITGSVDGITASSISLDLSSKTSLNVFYKPSNGAVPEIVSITDIARNDVKDDCTFRVQSDGRYKLIIPNIAADKLGDAYTIVVKKQGDDSGNTLTLNVSALSYARLTLNSATAKDSMKVAVQALYRYYQATDNYKIQK